MVVADLATGEIHQFNDQGSSYPITAGMALLDDADWVIGHNIVGYDIPVLQKFYPYFKPPQVLDTLVLSRLKYPDLRFKDLARHRETFPPRLYGRHSLEAWGYRLGCLKGEYGKTTDWSNWTQELEDYCKQDVNVSINLWHHFQKVYNGLP